MTTRLDKTLKREIEVGGHAYIVAVSPEGLKVTLKGKRNGTELGWADLVSGDAALAAALNASVGRLEPAAASDKRETITLAKVRPAAKRPAARSRRKRR
jgi:hypothetical protein